MMLFLLFLNKEKKNIKIFFLKIFAIKENKSEYRYELKLRKMIIKENNLDSNIELASFNSDPSYKLYVLYLIKKYVIFLIYI